MSINIQIINTAIVSFQGWIDRTNLIINAMANGVMTANTNANGSVTTGNSMLIGIFAANTIHANVISGGNVQSNLGSLSVFCNSIFLGNSLTNAIANSTYIFVPNATFSTTLTIGDGSTNTYIVPTIATFAGNVSANIVVSAARISVGTGATNTTINTTAVTTNTLITGTPASLGFKANTTAIQLNSKTYTNLDPYVFVSNNATLIGTRTTLNFISTASATAALVDNVAQDRVDITLSATTTPAGSDTYVQFNDGGVMGGISGFTFNKVGNTLFVANTITTANLVLGNPATTGFGANTSAIRLNGKTYSNLDPYIAVSNAASLIGTRPTINFISTATAIAAIADNAGQNRVDITLTSPSEIAGATTQVMFNDAGAFAGNAGFTYARTTNTVTIANTLSAANIVTVAFKANATHLVLNSKSYSNLDPFVQIANSGTLIGTRPKINFIATSSTTIDVTDNGAQDRVDVQIAINAAAISLGVIGGANTQVEFNDSGVFNGSAGLTYNKLLSNLTVANNLIAATANVSVLNLGVGKIDAATNTSIVLTATVVDAFFLADYRGAEYLVTIKDTLANNYQLSKLVLLHDGGSAIMTEYARVISNNDIGTFTASTNATHAILNYTPVTSNNTILKFIRNIITVTV